jgi:hypothetical protein
VPHEPPPRQPEGLTGLDQLGVHAPDPGVDVEVEREGHAERDDGDLGCLADAEPDDEQRDETHERHRPQHLHGRVHQVLADPEQAREQGESGADDQTEQQPGRDPLE